VENNGPVIIVEDLVKRFGSFIANDRLSFTVNRGEIFGFLGANGAGKTTAIRMLCGLLKPTSGTIIIDGLDGYSESEKIKKRIGYMSQRFSLYEDLTVDENIKFYGSIYGLRGKVLRQRCDELLLNLGLTTMRRKKIMDIPLGWKQKLAFSVAIIHNPGIVFLDEPSSGVDPITRRQFWEMIYQAADNGITVFVTTHYMDEAEYCDRVCILHDGKINALDTPENLKIRYNANTMDEVFVKIARPMLKSQ
jgi:ABC-2 type transport system ATP-binding protein